MLPIARQKQHFSLVTFLGLEQTPFVQPHSIYTSPSHTKHGPWKSSRACSWCVHAHCASPEGKNIPNSLLPASKVLQLLRVKTTSWSVSGVLGRLTEILPVGAHTSQLPKARSHTASHVLVVWLRAVVTDLGKATRKREFLCIHPPVPPEQGTHVCALIPQEN